MSWGAEALRCAGHGGGEVAATELAGGSVARGGGVQRVGKWVQRLRRCHVRRRAKQEVACGLPRWRAVALGASGREKQRSREVGDEVWTDLQFPKSLGALL